MQSQTVKMGSRVESFAWSPDGRSFAVVAERKVAVFEIASGKAQPRIDNLGTDAQSVRVAPDGRRLAVGLGDTSMLVFDLPKLARTPRTQP